MVFLKTRPRPPELTREPQAQSAIADAGSKTPTAGARLSGPGCCVNNTGWFCPVALLRRNDVLIHPEQVVRVIFRFDLGEAVVVLAIGGAHQLLSLIHDHVDVAATG